MTAAARLVDAVRVFDAAGSPVRALDGVSLEVESHRFTVVTGPSGSGKSTLLHCLAGLDRLTSGRVFIGDAELGGLDDGALTRLRRERVGVIFQSFNLLAGFDVVDNLTLPSIVAGHRPDPAWFDHVVDTLGLRQRLRHVPAQLSGGQRQRVAAARALMTRPDLIVADEPTGSLDSQTGAELLDLLRTAVADLGQTVVMVTHDPAAAALADRALTLRDGRLVPA
ncbi:MAG TPA: ABC transporter ATP-binding protein [Candidatus Dormibacteraeota bacterium]|nr:ABC transporter ATP-binding protein [Candidatus Dormibacteraeota bacterium]